MSSLLTKQNEQEVKIVQISDTLYNSWKELVAHWLGPDKLSHQECQVKVYAMLRKYILSNFPIYKLCAFEEIDADTAASINRPQGMYMKLRLMTPEELKLSMEMNKEEKLGKDGNPQWILELDHIPELRVLTYPATPEECTNT